MAEKDLLEKTLEEHNDVFADIVNALGFGGRMLVEPESLKPGPTASIYEDLGGQKREQHRDVVKYCTRSGVVLALFGLENQSGEDYDMVFRMMSYDGAAYKQQKGGRKKYPVISFVLYYGLEHWKAPQSLREAIVWPDEKTADASGWQRIIGLVPDYRINLVEVAFLPQAVRERFTSDFRIVAEYFHAKRTGTEAEFVAGPEGHRNIRHVKEMLDFFREFTGDERYLEMSREMERRSEKGESVMSCSMLDYAENKGIQKGIREGVRKGVRKGIQKGVQKGIREGTRALIESCRELNQSYDSTLQRLMDKFSLSRSEAEARMREYWKA